MKTLTHTLMHIHSLAHSFNSNARRVLKQTDDNETNDCALVSLVRGLNVRTNSLSKQLGVKCQMVRKEQKERLEK